MCSEKMVMMITPLMRDYKKGKRVNIKGGGGEVGKNREVERLRRRETRLGKQRG